MPRCVAVGSLGGTITMVPAADGPGITPGLGASDLVSVLQGLDLGVEVVAETLLRKPGASLSFGDVLRAIQWASDQVVAGAAGVVLVQGTDTLEETAFLADLVWVHPEPIVVTGAMRGAHALSADGAANVADAVRVAVCGSARERGALVVMNQQVHCAAVVRKTHSWALEAFESPGTGPAGVVVEGAVMFVQGRSVRHRSIAVTDMDVDVPVVLSALSDHGRTLRTLLEAQVDGVVLAAYGAGHVSSDESEIVEAWAPTLPVVISTRVGAGGTLSATYDFPGSEMDLQRRGAILAGRLDPLKSRILLATLLAGGHGRQGIADAFTARGRHPNAQPCESRVPPR